MMFFERKARRAEDDKTRAGALSNVKVLGVVGISMAVMFSIMQVFIMYSSYNEATSQDGKSPVDSLKIVCILMGLVFIVLGNFMTKTRRNGAVGVRVKWSMYNDNTWSKSNRFGAVALIIAGIATIITGAVMSNSFASTMVSLGYLLVAVTVTLIYSYRVYLKEVKCP